MVKEMSIKLKKNTNRKIFVGLMVFLLIFLSMSFVTANNVISSGATILMWLLLFVLETYLGRANINVQVTLVSMILCILMFLSYIFNEESIVVYFKISFGIAVATIFVSIISLKEFVLVYVFVLKFLSVISLMGYVTHLVFPAIFGLRIFTNSMGLTYSNWILYIQDVGNGISSMRNFGFAWEPGAFASCVCLAMFMDLFIIRNELSFKSIAIYLATVVTTFSTTGIIAIIILCIYAVFKSNEIDRKVKRKILITGMLSIFFLLPIKEIFFDTTTSSTFGKLINFFNSRGNQSNSTSIRVYSITKSLEAFLEKPLIGFGYDGLIERNYEYTFGMNTCTFINWFAVYGFGFGGLMFVGVYKFSRKLGSGLTCLFGIGFLFLITMTENLLHHVLMFILVLYGFKKEKALTMKVEKEIMY